MSTAPHNIPEDLYH